MIDTIREMPSVSSRNESAASIHYLADMRSISWKDSPSRRLRLDINYVKAHSAALLIREQERA